METKFQTSFIPKKPNFSPVGSISTGGAPRTKHTSSIFMTIATILFILSLASAGGVYAYKIYLLKAQDDYKKELATRQKQFNTNLIEDLKAESVRIDQARRLLTNHIAMSQIFDIIGRFTIENVRFLSFDASVPTAGSNDGSGIKINLQGYGTSLSAVAWQSDVLGQLDQYGLRKIVKNPILANPTTGTDNKVSFSLSAEVDPASLSYQKMITPDTATSSSTN